MNPGLQLHWGQLFQLFIPDSGCQTEWCRPIPLQVWDRPTAGEMDLSWHHHPRCNRLVHTNWNYFNVSELWEPWCDMVHPVLHWSQSVFLCKCEMSVYFRSPGPGASSQASQHVWLWRDCVCRLSGQRMCCSRKESCSVQVREWNVNVSLATKTVTLSLLYN